MNKFKQYTSNLSNLNEDNISWMKVNKFHFEFLESIMEESKKLGNKDLIFRGHKANMMGGVLLVTNDRKGFHGMQNPNSVALLKELGVENPTFGARLKIKAKMFGDVNIIVPKGHFKAYQSSEFSDLLAGFRTFEVQPDSEIKRIAKTYKETLDDINDQEIIFDVKEYYLIDIDYILRELDRGNKFQKYKPGTVNTYAELTEALKSCISFAKFKEKNKGTKGTKE